MEVKFMKKIFYTIISFSLLFFLIGSAFAASPEIDCGSLPGCDGGSLDGSGITTIIANVIATVIKYVAVIAVLAVMYGGVLYLLSSGEEEKTKKAKNVIIWALL